ncbi:hypothetical protein CRYUN_Cryun41cG0044500 [Craigia yunnanensis]
MKAPSKLKVLKRPICWKFPKHEYMKFNVDGSSKGMPGPTGVGGVLRDYSGEVKAIFSKAIELADSNITKLLAVFNPHGTPWAMKKYMAHIKVYKAHLLGWEIYHIPTEGNDIADVFTKSVVFRQDEMFVVWMGEPIGFGDLSNHERLGEFGESGSEGRHCLLCTNCFDALWFCYSPVHQMQQYYRVGVLENCSENGMFFGIACISKTKSSSQL